MHYGYFKDSNKQVCIVLSKKDGVRHLTNQTSGNSNFFEKERKRGSEEVQLCVGHPYSKIKLQVQSSCRMRKATSSNVPKL